MNQFSTVQAPIEHAHGLPNEHYIDQRIFDEEKQAVLFNNWAGVGFGKDIPAKGDAKPIDFLGMPLLAVRDSSGAINVFQNVCRHRGMILVDQPMKIRGAIRCPYHSWCYGLDGSLRTTPHIGGIGQNTHDDFDASELGLVKLPSHVYMDVIFVNINGNAAPFEEIHADLLQRWADFDQPQYHGGATSSYTLEVNCNWKLAVENFCESYHLPSIHPGLSSISRLGDHYNIDNRLEYSGQGSYLYQQLRDADGNVMPDFENLPSKWDEGAEYIAVYPNTLLGVQRDHTFVMVLQPLELNKTQEHVSIYYPAAEGTSARQDAMATENAERWKIVFQEDVFVVEGMQRGRHGQFFDGGRFAPAMEGPTHNFHKWVANQVEAGRS